MQQDLDASLNWIDILHGDSPGLVHICAFGDWEGQSFDWDIQRDEAARYIQAKDPAQGIYLRTTTLLKALEPGKRGSDTDSATLPGLWADIDLAGPGHKTTNKLPETFADAERILAAANLPTPTVWVHSGGGLYPMWLLTQTHRVANRDDFDQLRVLSAKWQEVIAHGASTLGLHYGTGVGDLSRVLRLPGTINRKEGLARPCKVLEDTWGPSYTLDELKDALVTAVQAIPDPLPPVVADPGLRPQRDGLSPGDDYEQRTSWADILEPAGWIWHHRTGRTDYWTRPGKSRRDGHSATTGHDPSRDRLFVLSTETELPAWEPITKFHAYTLLNHGGNWAAAARDLGRQGYGEQRTQLPSNVDRSIETPPVADAQPSLRLPRCRGLEDYTLEGAATRFVRNWGSIIRYVIEEKSWRVWNGSLWERDDSGAEVSQAFVAMTEVMHHELQQLEAEAEADESKAPLAKALRRHVAACRNGNRPNILSMIAGKVKAHITEFDTNPRYLNLQNGVYDLVADEFGPHDPKYMMTKIAGISYDKDAKAPRSEVFFGDLLPSEPLREFTLQSLAYSMTGEADRKALFISQGASNTGKTQIAELCQGLLGDYAVSVSPGTFTKRREHGPNPELHDMRGARFVYTSETSHDIQLDEELVKRVTGKDTMTTRTLYEKAQRWIPQCAVWIATNNLPRFSSDGEAMWRRIKTIRFANEFTDDGTSDHIAIPNIGRTLAAEEGPGLFNLLLAALRRYRAAGRLVEPQELKDSVAEHRQETDPLAQWVSVEIERGNLVAKPGAQANMSDLRKANAYWCEDQGYHPLAAQRFGTSLSMLIKYQKRRSNGETLVVGWEWRGVTWRASPFPRKDWHAVDQE